MLYRSGNYKRLLFFLPISIVMAIFAQSFPPVAAGEQADQRTYSSPSEAVAGLIAAVRDNNDTELLAILGAGSEELIFSGDAVADKNDRERFVTAFEANNRIVQESDSRAVLFVGINAYPFPILIVRQGDAWLFDTPSGKEELLNRRIGGNELHTIEVVRAYIDAQREYACIRQSGSGPQFAQKIASSDGQRDGLYWEAKEGEAQSPFGPLIARATEEGYAGRMDKAPPEPFHGYYFKILKAQGAHAAGGAFDYVADGKMVFGFALIAYPAMHGISGVMTFIVNQKGVIYEKDLGADTAAVAAAMTLFDPDDTWHKYEEPAAQ